MSSRRILLGACAILLAGCQAKPATFDPEDPVELAALDSLVAVAMAGAESADADRVLAFAEGPGEFTFTTGDVMLDGLASIKESFRSTYAGLTRQEHQIHAKRIRLLSPDVAILTAVGEGTYTDKAGWTSNPVGLGLTVVFVKQDGKWQARHAHQSVAF